MAFTNTSPLLVPTRAKEVSSGTHASLFIWYENAECQIQLILISSKVSRAYFELLIKF